MNSGKARWAAGKAQDLERQAEAVEQQQVGDWRQRQRRRQGAAGLRAVAARFRRVERRYRGEAA